MSDLMTTGTNSQFHLVLWPRCPKPNHIKPCWCDGVARCLANTRRGSRCRRMAHGAAVFCHQHIAAAIGDTK